MKKNIRYFGFSSIATLAAVLAAATGSAQERDNRHSGRAAVYGQLHESSLEQTTTPEKIVAVTRGSVAPTEIWRALEHAEKVECLACIPHVSKLLYNQHAKTREIAAWWLRRRVFGVFGPGEVYEKTVRTLNESSAELERAYAAEALGEFLTRAGAKHLARAAVSDSSPIVRRSAVRAMARMNTAGANGELAQAMSDESADVRLAAVKAASNVSVFSRLDALLELIGDDDVRVRRSAVETLGTMRVSDAVLGLIAKTDPELEPNAEVRKAAVAALGQIGESSDDAREAVEAAQADPDFLVQSAARIALRRL